MTFQTKMLNTVFIKPTVLAFGLILSSQVWASAADDLKAKLALMNSFEAKFSQQVKDEQGELLQSGQGTIALAHPLKIRWEQVSPDETLFVSDGEKTFYFDAFSEQVTVMKTNGLIDTTPFILLTTRDSAQWEKYQISNIAQGYRITPKPGIDSQVEILDIAFNKAQNLSAIKVTDLSGQVSSFTFKDSRVNGKLAGSLFSFNIPEGVVVDDQTQGE
ncbi:outer membrane lipoprotein carrier protein LolA [Pseudoalteromonas citrea]|uniref:Outer-membrane lipoprotein carrier protein n=1 Tax=Pseudoalteromonas citrea TaxID=43655 RepID=A0A5S3XUD6_9GAMM|nr:outer membrane lipoprotein chaperone LolA [Pseudoalteromonas citrea]TMP42196.1 outer membrane lipoprotein carrier protein LolA [Pseudoalteromonas citrea]TMP62334.1 outer membrane lipoprotein carrier protein LolA [Pseudoalteromonas citrea]